MSTGVVAAKDPMGGLWDQFHQAVRWARIFSIAVVAVFGLMALSQAVWIANSAAALHPLLGGLTWIAFAVAAFLVGMPAWRFLQMPRVVQPPEMPAPGCMDVSHLRAEARYIERYLRNCRRNPELTDKASVIDQALLDLKGVQLRLAEAPRSSVAAFDRELTDWTRSNMSRVLAELDQKADRLIYQESLTVGLATAASPNGTLDAFVMLWRSVRLTSQLAQMYYGRPGLWGTLAVCRDVSVATAMAGFLQNVTDSLGGLLARSIGGATGVVAGPAVDGATNALVLIRIGYLARERCRSYRQWDMQTRRSALATALTATQKVAFGLTSEILRQMGVGIGAVAGAVADGVTRAAGAAAEFVETIGGQAYSRTSTVVDQATTVISGRAAAAASTVVDAAQSAAGNVAGRAAHAAESAVAAAVEIGNSIQARLRDWKRRTED